VDRSGWVGWGLGLVAAAYLAFRIAISLSGDAEQIGYVVGFVGGAFLIALVVRWVYVRIRPAERRPSYWSPWILVLTAVIVLLAGQSIPRS
jgi:hypothetical protein